MQFFAKLWRKCVRSNGISCVIRIPIKRGWHFPQTISNEFDANIGVGNLLSCIYGVLFKFKSMYFTCSNSRPSEISRLHQIPKQFSLLFTPKCFYSFFIFLLLFWQLYFKNREDCDFYASKYYTWKLLTLDGCFWSMISVVHMPVSFKL